MPPSGKPHKPLILSMSIFIQSPSFLFLPRSLSPKTLTLTLTTRLQSRRRRCHRALSLTDHELLHALVGSFESDGCDAAAQLPAVRSYEGDLACLSLVGAVGTEQALTAAAAAADGGAAAEEHLSSGVPTMVVETVFPGSFDEHCTVSTILFLPAKKVKEKAKKLRSSPTADILYSNHNVSKNILAMTFRQVVLQHIWSFRLSLFSPGTERNMDELSSARKAEINFTVSSSDKRFLSALAGVVCSCVLENTENEYLGNVGCSSSSSKFNWFQKSNRISSVDSSVCLYRIPQAEIMKIAGKALEKYNLAKGEATTRERKVKHRWWVSPDHLKLGKSGDPGFTAWANESIPAFRLHIDANLFKDANLEGWKRLDDRWEVLLTHSQMVELANILDKYYEDQYTVPDKQLPCGLITHTSGISRNKHSLWEMLFVSLAGGSILIVVSVLAQLCWPHLLMVRKPSEQSASLSSYESDCSLQSAEDSEVEAFCTSVIKKIKDEIGWSGDIMFDKNVGAWTGLLPSCLRNEGPELRDATDIGETATDRCRDDGQPHAELSINSASPLVTNMGMQTTAQNIASYQVVLSGDGKIIGFQPTSRVAVNHWASNPLSKVLYEDRNLSPGLLEPSLKIPQPPKAVMLELLMSENPGSCFALARPVQ